MTQQTQSDDTLTCARCGESIKSGESRADALPATGLSEREVGYLIANAESLWAQANRAYRDLAGLVSDLSSVARSDFKPRPDYSWENKALAHSIIDVDRRVSSSLAALSEVAKTA